MVFKPGDLVQINPEQKPYLNPQDWDKFASRPLLVKSVSEERDWLCIDDTATSTMLDGRVDLFIPWVIQELIGIEELI